MMEARNARHREAGHPHGEDRAVERELAIDALGARHREPAKRKKADLTLLYSRLDDLAEKVELLAQASLMPEVELGLKSATDIPQKMIFDQLRELSRATASAQPIMRAQRRI